MSVPLVEALGDLDIGFAYDSRGIESEAMQFLSETLCTLAASFEVQGYCVSHPFARMRSARGMKKPGRLFRRRTPASAAEVGPEDAVQRFDNGICL